MLPIICFYLCFLVRLILGTTFTFRRRTVIYGYGACRGKKSCLSSTFQRRAVIYGYGACRGKIGIFPKINHIYLVKKKDTTLLVQINSKLPSSLFFFNYLNFMIIYFLNQKQRFFLLPCNLNLVQGP